MVAAERVALQLPPRRAAKAVKIAKISRAEGGQLQAPVGRRSPFGCSQCSVSELIDMLLASAAR